MAKVPQSQDDLKRHLEEQLAFLERSAEAFDDGFTDEAKRLAVTLRLLLHDTKHSKSLLGQLGLKDSDFVDSAFQDDPESIASHGGLVGIAVGKGKSELVARLDGDDPSWFRRVKFSDWWNAPVTRDLKGRLLSRRELVLAVANKDGGAHVDPELDEVYADLSRGNALGLYDATAEKLEPLTEPERVTIRQIAHEVLKTLKPEYEKKPKVEGVAIIGNWSATFTPHGAPSAAAKVGRNDLCPCGSERKYKRCCGKPGRGRK